MIYLNDKTINDLPFSWSDGLKIIEDSVKCLDVSDYAQPVKLYLRYNDLKNRIIAMPAYVGGEILQSGLKWIASFPNNIHKGMTRAHSVIILNEFDTGKPYCIINSGTISSIRTASVSGFLMDKYVKQKNYSEVKVGMTGFGPIGQHHLRMCQEVLQEKLSEIWIYDLNGVDFDKVPASLKTKVKEAKSWEEAYLDADVFMTCTVSKERYIDKAPKPGSLHLNVSLRDYKTDVFPWFKNAMVVDSWEEVCRENTDVEHFNQLCGLQKEDAIPMQAFLTEDYLSKLEPDQAIMFNPMGMAIFDISIASHFLNLSHQHNKGVVLN